MRALLATCVPLVIAVNREDEPEAATMIARQLGALANECVLACQLIEPASGREVVIETLLAVLDRLERQQSELRRWRLSWWGAMTMAEIVDDVLGVERTFPGLGRARRHPRAPLHRRGGLRDHA